MISLVGVSKAYGPQTVLDRVDWTVDAGERVGLAGANGAGKSTLLRIVAGTVEADSGEICLKREGRVGYLPQEIVGMGGQSVLQMAMGAFEDLRELEVRCRELESALETTDPNAAHYETILEDYGHAREDWDRRGAYDLESRAEQVLEGLGFSTVDFSRDVGEFSGGWQMRVALARLLLEQPDVLLLDEPTNHLDLEARNWLEGFLTSYPGAVVLVAHDRYFLDVTVTRIAEVEHGKVADYACNYSRYEIEKVVRREQQQKAFDSQQEEIERMENFIRKFRYQASKAKLVQSRVKQLEKLERVPPPPGSNKRLSLRLPPAPRSGREVLIADSLEKRYGDLCVYEGIDLTIERGERVALVGPNGAGKTTLVKLLAGVEPPTAGECRTGHKVVMGYFAQDQSSELAAEKSVLEELTGVAPYDMVPRLREILGAFLFSGEAVHKRTKVLSGGERNRLALAKLLLRENNCLLLDEPTNHLDIHAKDVLLEALQNYKGTIVIVSHDRFLLDELPDCVIEVGHGHATRYIGNYEDYLRAKAKEAEALAPPAKPPVVEATAPAAAPAAVADAPAPAKKGRRKKSKPSWKSGPSAEMLTKQIAELEAAQAKTYEVLSKPDFYMTHSDPQSLIAEYEASKAKVESLYADLEAAMAAEEAVGDEAAAT